MVTTMAACSDDGATTTDADSLRKTYQTLVSTASAKEFGSLTVTPWATIATAWDGSSWKIVSVAPGGDPAEDGRNERVGLHASPAPEGQVPWDQFSQHLEAVKGQCEGGKVRGELVHSAGGAWLEQVGCDTPHGLDVTKVYLDGREFPAATSFLTREQFEAELTMAKKLLPKKVGLAQFSINAIPEQRLRAASGVVKGTCSVHYGPRGTASEPVAS